MTNRDEPNLHKNNAAEWMMVGLLFPVWLAYAIYSWARGRLRSSR